MNISFITYFKKNDSRIEWGLFDTSGQNIFEKFKPYPNVTDLPPFVGGAEGFVPTAGVSRPSLNWLTLVGNFRNNSELVASGYCKFTWITNDSKIDYQQDCSRYKGIDVVAIYRIFIENRKTFIIGLKTIKIQLSGLSVQMAGDTDPKYGN